MMVNTITISQLAGQTTSWDSGGNTLIFGTFNFRQVSYQLADGSGNLAVGRALSGKIAFDGKGHYTTAGATLITRSQAGTSTQTIPSFSGTYSMASNGYGFVYDLYCPFTACANNNLGVLLAQGMLVGSSPDANLSDVFIAAPVSTTQSITAGFQGSWTIAAAIPAIAAPAANSADAFFRITPDAAGSLGPVMMAGYIGSGAGAETTQSLGPMSYTASGDSVTVAFPANPVLSGEETLYFSPDATFCFGGSANAPDLVVGVRDPAPGATQSLTGIYYQAGIQQNEYWVAQNAVDFTTYYGAFNASGTHLIEANRVLPPVYSSALTSNTAYTIPAAITGTYNNQNLDTYALNANGTVRIGAGHWPMIGVSVALKASVMSGSGVYLNPSGIANAASFAPFIAGISPGEYLVLYGSNLAAGTAKAESLPLPTTLQNVKVTFNGIAAPIFYVTPGQLSVIVPSNVTGPVAQLQVISDGVASNVVSAFVYPTSPGLFTAGSDGVSLGAVEHADGSLVTESNPAVPGETLQTFLTGLGPVSPAVPDGAAASFTPLSRTMWSLNAFIGWARSAITFSGLVPTLAGLYQINILVPDNVPNGDQLFEIDGPASAVTQGIIPVLSGNTEQQPPAPQAFPRSFAQ